MIAFLGDMHIGARSGNKLYHEYFALFYKDFFDWIDSNGVKEIVQVGDMFDVRKHVDTWCLKFFEDTFVQEIVKRNLKVYVIVGNHDIHFRESLEVNTPALVLSKWKDNFVVIDKPKDITIDNKKFLLVPWITKNNRDEIEDAIALSSSDYLVGHFEFNGFPMHKGSSAKSKHLHTSYGKFKKIISGHYHTRSEKDNVIYTGTPYELTWVDCGDQKGFYSLDDDFSFVPNIHTFHEYVVYPNQKDIKNKFVRGVANDVEDKKALEKWKDSLIKMNPHDIKFQEKTIAVLSENSVDSSNIKSTEDIIRDSIREMTTTLQIDKIEKMMIECYHSVQGDNDD